MTTVLEVAPERVVVIAFGSGGVKRVNSYVADVAERGVQVTVLAADGQGWRRALPLHPAAEVYSLGRAENRVPLLWAYTALVERLPGGVLRRLESGLPGVLGRAAGRGRRLHRKAAGKLRKWLFWPVYRPLRSHTMRRLALRRLDALDLASASRVICADEATVPFGWTVAKRFPDLEVTRKFDRAVYEDRPVRPLPDPEGPDRPGRSPYLPL